MQQPSFTGSQQSEMANISGTLACSASLINTKELILQTFNRRGVAGLLLNGCLHACGVCHQQVISHHLQQQQLCLIKMSACLHRLIQFLKAQCR